MDKRMNKQEMIDLINSLKIDKSEFYVVSSGALVLRNLLQDAGDLDIAVTDKGFEQLQNNYNLTMREDGWFRVSENVEGVCNGAKEYWEYQPELYEGIYLQNINEYYNYLLTSEREKDKKRIPIVDKYIKENNK